MRTVNVALGMLMLCLLGCQSRGEVVEYWVNSSRVPCTGVGPRECLEVQRGGSLTEGSWQPFYASIEGFDYVPGKVYHLRVRETKRSAAATPADASTTVYTLVDMLEAQDDPALRLSDIWALERVGNDTVDAFKIVPLQQPTLELQVAENRVSGLDGCNRFSGQLVAAGANELQFGELASTRMACPTKSNLPQRILTALNEVRSYRREGMKLTLLDGAGQELLHYRKVD